MRAATTISKRDAASCSPHPDWDHVPFDVGCARCGHDLRGLTDPKCPACQLEFGWADAVPIEQLTCETCDYHLYGLTEGRCPECGDEFVWDDVLAAFHRRKQMLFEYHWRTKPVRSLLATWRRSLRPGKLWAELDIHDPPAVRPLISQVVLVAILAWALTVLLEGTWVWLSRPPWRRQMAGPGFAEALIGAVRDQEIYLMVPLIVGWAAITLLSLLILRQSMRRYRVRNAHVLRVCAYALPPLIVPVALASYSYNIAVLLLGGWGYRYWVDYLCAAVVLIFAIWSIRQGYRKYLKIPHSLGIAIASQVMALLALSVIGDLMTNGRFVVRNLYRVYRWMMSLLNS